MAKMDLEDVDIQDAPPLKGVHTSAPDPSFDPLTASDADLAANYLPPRPDSRTAPTAFANWQRALGTRPRFVASAATPAAEPPPDKDKVFFTHPNDGRTQASSGNWSGGLVRPRNDDPLVLVQGRWIVPDTQSPGKNVPFASSVWVGLDGYDPASRVMPQIGTGQLYFLVPSPAGNLHVQTYVAWWQVWLKHHPRRGSIWQQPIPTMPIEPEDRFYGQVQKIDDLMMSFFLKNETRNVAFSAFYDLRADHAGDDLLPLECRTAEWVLERPTVPDADGVTPLSVPLANYGETAFTDCNAATQAPNGILSEFQLQRASLFRMNQWVELPSSKYALAPPDEEPGRLTSLPRRIGDDALLMRYIGR
jgi:Peptidase A4 family